MLSGSVPRMPGTTVRPVVRVGVDVARAGKTATEVRSAVTATDDLVVELTRLTAYRADLMSDRGKPAA